ncbi:MAG: DUF2610 domain-containing protein [Rickettsiales bacterium]|nr:DUF2610 domain-containing protein [Rickettsiales bacterium]
MVMKKLAIPCSFGAQSHSVDFYVGQPKIDKHPIQNQSSWLSSNRGGSVPGNVMDSLEKLHDLSKKNRVNFAELCEYAVTTAGTSSIDSSAKNFIESSKANVKPAEQTQAQSQQQVQPQQQQTQAQTQQQAQPQPQQAQPQPQQTQPQPQQAQPQPQQTQPQAQSQSQEQVQSNQSSQLQAKASTFVLSKNSSEAKSGGVDDAVDGSDPSYVSDKQIDDFLDS